MLLITALLSSICFLFIYLVFKHNSKYWKRKNIPHSKPHLFFGNFKEVLLMQKSMLKIYTDIYNDFQQFPYVGFFKVREPGLVIRDPNLIYDILTKDFLSFATNDVKVDEKVDPLIAKNPFLLDGEKWRTNRSRMTGCLTSRKLKLMVPFLTKIGENMVHYIESQIASGFSTMNNKELATKFTADNVASCAFGIEANSFAEPEAEFLKMAQKIFTPTLQQKLNILFITLFPALVKILKARIIPEDVHRYFISIVNQVLQYREDNRVVRNDFLDITKNIRKQEPSFTVEDITGLALVFFIDGYETSAISINFTVYELAANPSVQNIVKKEIDETLAKHNNILTYECLQEMTYLECVILESLRLHPPTAILMKLCTKDYYFPPINGNVKELLVKSNTPIIIPIYGIHRDLKYFPNPDVFDPSRFSSENKSKIKKGTYLPFGDGPRECLGQRFALLQIKVALAVLIRNFEVRVNKKTKEPLDIDSLDIFVAVKHGIWIDYYKRR